jgi:hypothetical protein
LLWNVYGPKLVNHNYPVLYTYENY